MKRKNKSGMIPCFKRWTRTNYGAFASLGREVKIGVLSVTMCIVALGPKSASAQSDTLRVAKTVELEVLSVVTEKLNPTRGVVTPIAVYGRDTLNAMPLQTIENVLRLDPAIDLRERGSKGVQADISLRGGTYDQTMVLLNGINFTDPRTGHQSHSLPIDLEAVSSVDIIGGLTGIGAYAGALNITTAPLRPVYLRAEVTGGQYGYLYSNISGAVSRDKLSVTAAGSVRKSDGYAENTDFNNFNLFTRINYSSAAGLFDIQAGYQNRGMGENSFYSFSFPDQFEHTETALGSVRWTRDLGSLGLNAHISYRKNNDRFELYRGGRNAPDGWLPNYHTTDNVGAEVSGDYRWKGGKSTLGFDYTYNHIYSNVLGEALSDPVKVRSANGVYYTKAKSRNIYNAWLSHAAQFGMTTLSGSFNLAGSPYGIFPSWCVSVKQKFGQAWGLGLSATRSMRLPTFTDLYYNTPTHIGNSNLRPEKALTTLVSASYAEGKISVSANMYGRFGSDIIDWVKESQDAKWQAMQITGLTTFGAEVSAAYLFDKFVKTVSVGYGYITMNKKNEGYISKYALDYMKHKLAVKGAFRLYKAMELDITATWYDRNGSYEIVAGQPLAYTPYWLVDARLSWRKGSWTVYMDASNLLDQKYFDFGGIVLAPRWISAGIVIMI